MVRRARRRADDKEVALKIVRSENEKFAEITRREYKLLRSLEHPHIVNAFDFFTTMNRAVIVMEFFDGIPLDTAVRTAPSRRFTELKARAFFRQLVQAMKYLHQHRILHCDIKGQNVLVAIAAARPDLRLVDFNVARLLDGSSLAATGTLDYAAPEILAGGPASMAGDVWAAGLCLHLMVTGHLTHRIDAFATASDFAEALAPLRAGGGGLSEPCAATLRSCLDVSQASRATAEALLRRSWLGSGAAEVDAETRHLVSTPSLGN